MKKKLILIGAGGHSQSVIESLDKKRYVVCGFVDNIKKGKYMNLPIFGDKIIDIDNYKRYVYFVSIGDVYARKEWFDKLKSLNLTIINIIDKTANISKNVKMGVGNFFGKYSIVNSGATIGDNNIINSKALVEHACILNNHIHISTNATINGDTVVEDLVFFGSTAVANGQLKIGKNSVVGSGSVVIRDVEPFTTVVGVPARIIKRNIFDN